MSDLSEILQELTRPGPLSAAVRLTVAMICGGIIGLERGRRRRPAGFRTHMLVCMGAALTMLIGQYVATRLAADPSLAGRTTDVARLGAQVINGIGFLGAGTIIVTGRQEVKGLTTAAGLWASACMGLAIGAGFYLGALLGGVTGWLLGRSRRGAFICGVAGMLLADTAVALVNWAQGLDVRLALGGAGIADAAVLSGVFSVLLCELVGEIIERLGRRRGGKPA